MKSQYKNNTLLNTNQKFGVAIFFAIIGVIFSLWIAQPGIFSLSDYVGTIAANIIIYGIAIIPGFMNMFIMISLLLDKRPKIKEYSAYKYPPLTVLIAAYNEEKIIEKTIDSLLNQEYSNTLKIIVCDDGSTDNTKEIVIKLMHKYPKNVKMLTYKHNVGKYHALNSGLKHVDTSIFITIDADSVLYKNAIKNIVGRYLSDPINTASVAGAVLVRNSRENIITKIQEWDYFHGIAAIKRIQSLYQGTLVAQGAFSLYRTNIIKKIGGGKNTLGEDIVLTWDMLRLGYRVGYAENACLFTTAPSTGKVFFRQRQRGSRGMIEAFKYNWKLLFKGRKTTIFIWFNLFFPYMDLIYTFVFIPGIILALFGYFFIAGPLTLLVLPLAMIINYVMFNRSNKMFIEQGLKVRKNIFGFFLYSIFYGIILQPACVLGYIKELFGRRKSG